MSVKDSLGYYNSPVPIGTVTAFAGVNAPIKWLLCNGQSIQTGVEEEYDQLFRVIGYTFSQTSQDPGNQLLGTITFLQNNINFTAVITNGFLYAGKRIVVELTPPPFLSEQAVLVATYDATTGIGTFATAINFDGSAGLPLAADDDYFNLPYLNGSGRAIIGGATTSATPTAAGITGGSISIAAANLPAFNPAIQSSSFSASILIDNTYEATQATQQCDGAFASFSVATPFPTSNTFTPTFVSKTMTYTTTGSGGIPTPVTASFSGVGAINFNNLEMTYIIKYEY